MNLIISLTNGRASRRKEEKDRRRTGRVLSYLEGHLGYKDGSKDIVGNGEEKPFLEHRMEK